ncbi:MAG: 4Fe-4S binding protein [Phycisphaerales bacterium]|nr:4Fe-4S binding protein [Phycisphaerales bacterium]
MIELRVLSYSHDEERIGFTDPPRATPRPINIGERAGMAMLATGAFAFVICGMAGVRRGSWPALIASFGLITIGGCVYYWRRWAGSTPGIKHDGNTFNNVQTRGLWAWGLAIVITLFYIAYYWYHELKAIGMPPVLDGTIRLVDPLSLALRGKPADQWFMYSFLYTLAVLIFGVRMVMKYRHNRYHLIRTASVSFFQLGFAFLLPGILVALHQPDHYFTYFWPLSPQPLWPGDGYGFGAGKFHALADKGVMGMFILGFSAFMFLLATPVLTYLFGKRWYCSWVCGCGGLAETLGDPWRQLSDKSTTAWKIERWMIHSVLVAIVLVTAFLWIDYAQSGAITGTWAMPLRKVYYFVIVQVFAGVIGVGFYPLMGSRVWCRFGCPMAAALGILQRYFSRFRITTNGGQCMSCGNCSTYCEMGIDVRGYAQRGENIVRASCVGCGVCAAVCPRGVLKLENGASSEGRYEGVGGPLPQLVHDLRNPPVAQQAEGPARIAQTREGTR